MKKLFSFVLTVILSTSFAFAGSDKGIKQVFEELQYNLTVEWDQKDVSFKEAAMANFTAQLESLKAEGLSDQELMNFARSEIKNPELFKVIEDASIKLKAKAISHDEFAQVINKGLVQSQMRGASWNDQATLGVFVGVVFAVLILASVYDIPVYTSVGVSVY